MVGRAFGLGIAPSTALAAPEAVGSADATLRPASGRGPEVLRLIGRGVLVAAGAVGISLLFSAAKTHATNDAPDDPPSDLAVLTPVTELLAPVTDVLAPVIETATPVVESVVGVVTAPQPEATATQAVPATLDAAATETPDVGVASAPTVLAPVTELLAPVTEALAPTADPAVEAEASQPNQSMMAQAAPVSVDTETAESPTGVVPEPTSTTNDPTATVLAASPGAAPPAAKSGFLAETIGSLAGILTSVTDSTTAANDPAATAVLASGPDAAPAGDLVSGTVGAVLDVVKSMPGVDVVLPAGGDADLLAPVTGLVGGLDVLDILQPVTAIVEPVIGSVTGVVEPVVAAVAPVAGSLPIIGDLVAGVTPVADSVPVVGDLVASTATVQPEMTLAATPAAAATPDSVAAAAPTPVAAAAVTVPVSAATPAPTVSQRSTTPAPNATPAASTSLPKISADSPDGGVGPSVETPVVSSDPYRDLAGVDHPAPPRDVTQLAVGSTPGVNTATSSSASHGDQAVVNTTASPSGGSTGERVQLERAAVRAGVSANRVPTPE